MKSSTEKCQRRMLQQSNFNKMNAEFYKKTNFESRTCDFESKMTAFITN